MLILNLTFMRTQLENRDLEKKLQDAQRKIESLQGENEALQTRMNAVGIKERLTPSKRGRKYITIFKLHISFEGYNTSHVMINPNLLLGLIMILPNNNLWHQT